MALHSGGDILAVQKEADKPWFGDAFVNGDATVHHLVAGRTNYTVMVQKITVFYVTHANAKTITFQDTAGSPVPLGTLNDFTAGAGVSDKIEIDFGPHGIAIASGKGFDVAGSSSGPVANVHAEGYMKLASVIDLTTASSAS